MKLLTLFTILLLLTFATFAQSYPDEEFAIEAVYLKRNLNFDDIQSNLKPDAANDSVGFRIGYTHFFGRENARGDVGIGVEGGATFHKYGDSTVALGRGQYKLVLQANGNEKFKPFVKGTIGIARENFKNINVCSGTGGSLSFCGAEWSESFGAGVGLDIGKKRTRFRIGAEYFTTTFGPSRQHNLELSVGVAL